MVMVRLPRHEPEMSEDHSVHLVMWYHGAACRSRHGRHDGSGSFAVLPPSSTMISPVRKLELSLARCTARSPTSVGRPTRPRGCRRFRASRPAAGSGWDSRYVSLSSEAIHPGAMALHRMLSAPRSTAMARVIPWMPALDAQ